MVMPFFSAWANAAVAKAAMSAKTAIVDQRRMGTSSTDAETYR
jgi:hypothetical protein